jgi:hypothetical protein
MAGRARLSVIAAALIPLPLIAAVSWEIETGSARGLPQLAVSSRDGDLYVGEHLITPTPAIDTEPDWSPDGRRVAFVRQEAGRRMSSLYVVRRDGSGLERLTRAEQVVTQPAWSGDGRSIAYAASPLAGGSFDVYVISIDGGRPNVVASGLKEQLFPRFSGGKVVFRTLEPGEPFPEKTADAGTPQSGPRELLPDFDQRAPFRLTVAGTKLGFASATDNIGDGPIWVRGRRQVAAGPMVADQLVRLTDGRVRAYEDAGRIRYTFSPTHTHWHLLDFQRYELRSLDGELIVRDRKSGFCLADHYGLARRLVARFTGASFLDNCGESKPGALSVEQGTSPGFTDLYPAHFHGQHLELGGVPAGTYVLVHRANPNQQLEEIDYTNNDASLRIRLTWKGGAPLVETLRTCPDSDIC